MEKGSLPRREREYIDISALGTERRNSGREAVAPDVTKETCLVISNNAINCQNLKIRECYINRCIDFL